MILSKSQTRSQKASNLFPCLNLLQSNSHREESFWSTVDCVRATHNEIRKIIRKKNSNAVSPLIRELNAIIARTVAVTYLSKGKRSKELMTIGQTNS